MMLPATTILLLGPAVVLAWSPPPQLTYSRVSCAHHLAGGPNSFGCRQQQGTKTPSALHVSHEFLKSRDGWHKQTSTFQNSVDDELEIGEMKIADSKSKDAQDDVRESPPITIKDAASIIAGCAIGGGFLALPSVTSPIGYGPTALGLVAVWGFLLLNAFALIEAAGLVSDARSRKDKSPAYKKDEDTEGGLAVSSIIREAFGRRWGIVSGVAFVAQMLAIMTIQVVKGGAIMSQLTRIPYVMGCVIPTVLAGSFVYLARPEVAEGANTSLTAMMIGGFALLCVAAVTVGNTGAASAACFARADWASLLPTSKTTWSIPVLMKLLAWGEAMPLLIERMVEATSKSSSRGTSVDNSSSEEETKVNDGAGDTIAIRAKVQKDLKKATTLGAFAPLSLCLVWAAISTALVDPTSADPIAFLLSATPAISIPVGLLSVGAIGTTLLSSFLTVSHFASDVITTLVGSSDSKWMILARLLMVALPCVTALAGPGLYLPLLAFSGAYPTTLLYGFAPPLAILVLRHRAKKEGVEQSQLSPALVPGGKPTIFALIATALAIVGSCTGQAVRNVLRA